MNNTIMTIMKKELARFFQDQRMVLTTILLPGIMIYVMYSFMGTAFSSQFGSDEEYEAKIAVIDLPESVQQLAKTAELKLTEEEPSKLEKIKGQIEEQELDLCLVFPEDFDQKVSDYDVTTQNAAPNVAIYYNTASTESNALYSSMVQLLDSYEGSMANKFDVNSESGDEVYDLATEQDTVGSMFSSMLPMLLLVFLFSGCMSIAPESISGEKERGTIATLLITPAKRGDIAIGKIVALSIIALLSGLSSTLGTVLSLPKLMASEGNEVNTNVYQLTDYLLLLVVILVTVLVIVAVISIISAFAKTAKEAQTYVTPLMIVVILVGVTAMFGNGPKTDWFYYLIPLYNSVQSMVAIFSFEIQGSFIVLTVVTNLVYTVLGALVLTKMFNSEKVIFSK